MQEQRTFKHHPIPYNRFRYPVGENIIENEPAFRNLIEQFIVIADGDITTYSKVNLVCMGSSGSIVSTMMYLALRAKHPTLNVQIIHIKKDKEDSHSRKFQGIPNQYDDSVLHVWVDDHIDRGGTVGQCIKRYRENDDSYADFKFDWAVCLSSEYSISESKQLELFETFAHNMVCNISHYCHIGTI